MKNNFNISLTASILFKGIKADTLKEAKEIAMSALEEALPPVKGKRGAAVVFKASLES